MDDKKYTIHDAMKIDAAISGLTPAIRGYEREHHGSVALLNPIQKLEGSATKKVVARGLFSAIASFEHVCREFPEVRSEVPANLLEMVRQADKHLNEHYTFL